MRIRVRGWRAWFVIAAAGVAAAGGAVAYVVWATRKVPVPAGAERGQPEFLSRILGVRISATRFGASRLTGLAGFAQQLERFPQRGAFCPLKWGAIVGENRCSR